MFFNRKQKPFLTESEIETVKESLVDNEKNTSGEIRLCIESHCPYVDPMNRARELFYQLKMFNTVDRNAVLIYIAYKDHDFALFGDGAIYDKLDQSFWQQESKRLSYHFFHQNKVEGIVACLNQVGEKLKTLFPHVGEKKNELPDEIVFGK